MFIIDSISHQDKLENPKGRRERKKEETKKNIVSTAISLFEKQGYNSTTMEQIAEEVDISKVTLYNYFSSKEAIVSAFFLSMSSEFLDLVLSDLENQTDTRSKLYEMFRQLFEWNAQYKELIQIYFVYEFQSMLNPENFQGSGLDIVLGQIIRYGQMNGEVRDDLPTEYLAKHLEMMYVMHFMVWVLEPETWNAENNLGTMVDLFMNGARI